MKYGIIVCSKCKNPKAVILTHKTTRCIRCGKVLKLDKLKIFYKTNSEREIRYYLGLINAELAGKKKDFEKLHSSNSKLY